MQQFRPDFSEKGRADLTRRVLSGEAFTGVSRVRVWPFWVILSLFSLFLLLRLGQLTIVEGASYRAEADANRVLGVRIGANRGILTDRNGEPLVRNVPSYKRQVPGTRLAQAQFESLNREEAMRLSQQEGERVFYEAQREYVCGRACASIVGYLSEVTYDDLNRLDNSYVVGDLEGKSGVERSLEEILRGAPGEEFVEVDALGKVVREVGGDTERSGMDVQLTIDKRLQEVLYAALEGRKGAAVAQNPKTGEVLAWVSSPAYDPNDLGSSLKEEGEPFFDRVNQGAYPPGSVFKIVSAIAGLESEAVKAETAFEDTGELVIDEYSYGNWYYHEYGRVEGAVDVVKALQRSNDIYFYQLGRETGADAIAEYARLMGYGRELGLPGIRGVAGVVPTPEWKERIKGERWYLGNTFHMAIGQGDVLTTPLQVNTMMGSVAAGGVLCDPVIEMNGVGEKGCAQLGISTRTLEVVEEGLVKACQPGGTGVPFFDFEPQMACKTGTAQQGGEDDLPHAWFSVYGPVNNPEIAITVLVEHAGQGSEVAAPVAKAGMEYWFSRKAY